jgi:hemerythrin-like domain-containing protein
MVRARPQDNFREARFTRGHPFATLHRGPAGAGTARCGFPLVCAHHDRSAAIDLWRLITNDHANIADLCGEIPRAFPDGVRSRARLFSELDVELRRHLEAEEESLYDALEDHDRTEHLVAELEHEHEEIERRLGELARARDKGTRDWLRRFRDLAALIEAHFHREEHELLPLAREILDEEEVRELRHEYVEENIEALRAHRRAEGRRHSWREAAGILGLHPESVRALAGAGVLGADRLGNGTIAVSDEAIESFRRA